MRIHVVRQLIRQGKNFFEELNFTLIHHLCLLILPNLYLFPHENNS